MTAPVLMINLLGPGGVPTPVWAAGIQRPTLRRLLAEVETHRDALLTEWTRIHGPVT